MNKKLLYRYFANETTLSEEVQIRKWVETSKENEALFLRERKLYDMFILTAGLNTNNRKKKLSLWKRKAGVMLKIAGIIILAIIADRSFIHLQQTQTAIHEQIISTPAGQRTHLILPDGTYVWINARSSLRYSVDYSGKERRVTLDGEAYFEVAENPEKPFIVETTKGTVEALGTQFNVEAYSNLPAYEVALIKGKVRVTSVESPQTIILSPATKTVLINGKLRVFRVDNLNPYRWREGLICFETQSFESIMRSFEKYYGIEIRIENPNVSKYTYTGKFRQSDGIEYALHILQRDIRFSYKRDDDNNIIYIK